MENVTRISNQQVKYKHKTRRSRKIKSAADKNQKTATCHKEKQEEKRNQTNTGQTEDKKEANKRDCKTEKTHRMRARADPSVDGHARTHHTNTSAHVAAATCAIARGVESARRRRPERTSAVALRKVELNRRRAHYLTQC